MDGSPISVRRPGERIRVALFVNSIEVGGMEEHVELLARHLDRKVFEVFALCPDSTPIHSFSRSLSEVADHCTLITPDWRHGIVLLAAETAKLSVLLRKWRIDVLHMHSTSYDGEFFALIAARIAAVPRIFVTEHLAPEGKLPVSEAATRDVFTRLVTGIVCVSRKNLEARSAYLYTPADRAVVVNNGVDLDDFTAIPPENFRELRAHHRIPEDAEIVGTAIRFEPGKGLSYLVDAMPLIKAARPRAFFLMVGDGSLRDELTLHVARLGLTEGVRFVGFQADPRPYISVMDAFVLPVPVGSMSIGLLEAMAMRSAVVITFGGEGEAVVHGESGFCAEPRNPASIAEFVIRLLADPALRQSFGLAARRRVEEHFSAERVARTLGELYQGGWPK